MLRHNQEISKREYDEIHSWLKEVGGIIKTCEHCGITTSPRFDYALKKGCTYAKDLLRFLKLCKSCHVKYDYTEERKEKLRNATYHTIGARNKRRSVQ